MCNALLSSPLLSSPLLSSPLLVPPCPVPSSLFSLPFILTFFSSPSSLFFSLYFYFFHSSSSLHLFLLFASLTFYHRANKQFFDAVDASLTVNNGSKDKEWVQVYRGIAAGLGKENFDFDKCVEDGNATVALFKQAFDAFEDRQIYKGIQLIGQALTDVYKAFEDCGETDIAKALEKLATAFIQCTKGRLSLFPRPLAGAVK